MLVDNVPSHSPCSNYDERHPHFKAAPWTSSEDEEEYDYGPEDPRATAHLL